MPRIIYSKEDKDKIMKAVAKARSDSKSWAEAHAAAKDLGYKGNVPALQQMMAKTGPKKKGAKRGPKPATPTKAVSAAAPASDIGKFVHDQVKGAIVGALKSILASIEGGEHGNG